jgi:cytochrome c biogenesis protein CcmG/thiol:disulfide interchange protein DsbE
MKFFFRGKIPAPGAAAVVVLGALLVYAFSGVSTACARPDAAGQMTPAPDFTVTDIQGRSLSLADFRGKVLVLNFWATWCPPCRAEIPGFIEAVKNLGDKGLAVIGLSVDEVPAAKLSAWVTKAGINYPVAIATEKIVTDYRPGEYIPSTIVIDGKGRIRHRHTGMMDQETLEKLFEEFK